MTNYISDEYRETLLAYRASDKRPNWGNGGGRHLRRIQHLIEVKKPRTKTILDYGCGKGLLLRSLIAVTLIEPENAQFYDPGIPEYSDLPEEADMLITTDCLEHVEPEKLDSVLLHQVALTRNIAYINVHTKHAKAILPDGRNAHLTQEEPEWWEKKLSALWSSVEVADGSNIRPSWVCRP